MHEHYGKEGIGAQKKGTKRVRTGQDPEKGELQKPS